MDNTAQFLKKEIISYIDREKQKGHSLDKIREALLNAGHHRDLVQAAIKSLKKHGWNPVLAIEEPISDKLQRELYFDVINSIIRFIEYGLERGKSIPEIEQSLIEAGHSHEIINSAMESMVEKKKSEEKRQAEYGMSNFVPKLIKVLSVLALAVLVLLLAANSKVPIIRVALGLLPTILTLVVSVAIYDRVKVKSFIALMPFAFVMLFVFAGYYIGGKAFEGMDIKTLAIVNLVISIFYTGIMMASSGGYKEFGRQKKDMES